MRFAFAVTLVLAVSSCAKKAPELESDAVEAYRFMYGALAADLCINSLHMLALDRKNFERGNFEPHDRAVIVNNEAALKRLRADFETSLSTLYADETRRTRDSALSPLFDVSIACHAMFLQYVDARSPEHLEKYLACQQRFSALIQPGALPAAPTPPSATEPASHGLQ